MRMRIHRVSPLLVGAAVSLAVGPLYGQSDHPSGVAGPPPHARALAEIGRSGLRGLLSASGGLGDLQNRVGSYRMAVQLEGARAGGLEGRIAALDRALDSPELSPGERTALGELREAARTELGAVPRYEAAYRTSTLQLERLAPFGFVGDRPLLLLVRARGHVRWGGPDGLTVFSEVVSLGPVLMASERWILSPGVALGRTDVDIGPFEGSSHTTSIGPRLDVGGVLGEGWSVVGQLAHTWSRGASTILRPGPDGGKVVRSEGWSRVTAAKAELQGRFASRGLRGVPVAVRPRLGAFVLSSHAPAATNSLGETGTGPFGEWESLAVVRAGASLEGDLGAWTPRLHVGWEAELTDEMSALVDDPTALFAEAGLSWSWARGRRLSLDYRVVRGFERLRRVSDLTLVLILDG